MSLNVMGNPLDKIQVRLHFPEEVISIGDAVYYLLEPCDYKLVVDGEAPKDSLEIGLEAIPAAAKRGQVLTLKNALLLVIGEDKRLVVDHQHKLISFERINPSKKVV